MRLVGKIGLQDIFKEMNLQYPAMSEDSINALNEYVKAMVSFILKKANEYRMNRGTLKRLSRTDVEMAYKDWLISRK